MMFELQPEYKYFKNLDGLRFLAAFAVIIGHSQSLIFEKGVRVFSPFANKLANFGVDFFFVLSGFLISYLLLREIDKTGKINIRYFYYRRFLRIWPVYFAYGLIALAVGKFFIDWFNYAPSYSHDYSFKDYLYNVFFLGTFSINFQAFLGFHRPVSSLMVGHFWSLGIEEQFYLIWAPCMYLFRKNTWILILLFISIGWYFNRIPLEKVSQYTEFHINFTVNRFFHFGLGAALAWLIRYFPFIEIKDFLLKRIIQYTPPSVLRSLKPEYIFQTLMIIAQFWFLWQSADYLFGDTYSLKERLFNGWVSAGIITVAIMEYSLLFFLMLENKVFKYLGKISFGIYIYHLLSVHLADKLLEMNGITVNNDKFAFYLVAISTVFSVLSAAISYQYFEKYFLNLKSKFHAL